MNDDAPQDRLSRSSDYYLKPSLFPGMIDSEVMKLLARLARIRSIKLHGNLTPEYRLIIENSLNGEPELRGLPMKSTFFQHFQSMRIKRYDRMFPFVKVRHVVHCKKILIFWVLPFLVPASVSVI